MTFAVRLKPILFRTRDIKRQVEMEVVRQIDREAAEVLKLFRMTTESWDHKVEFKVLQRKSWGGLYTAVGTDDPIYRYVNDGTAEHLIFPKNARALAFQWNGPGSYRPKTTPGVIGSQGGGPTGDMVYKKGVIHPGTKPRGFAKAIESYWQTRYPKNIQEAITRGFQH